MMHASDVLPTATTSATNTRDEQGVTLILVALLLTVLMIVAALFIDGGGSYAVRRSMQNAADAAAMAGGQALYKAIQAGGITAGSATDVYQQAFSAAITNNGGAIPTDGEDLCDYVDSSGNLKGVCTSSGTPPATAVGVRINVQNTRTSFFGRFAGQSSLTVRGHAAASIEPLSGTAAPWVICGSTSNSGYDFLTDGTNDGELNDGTDAGTDPDDTLKSPTVLLPIYGWGGSNTVNRPSSSSDPKATLMVQVNSPQGSTKCGSGSSSADGKGGGEVLADGMQSVSPGNGSDKITNNSNSVPVGTCYNNGADQTCKPCPTGTYKPDSSTLGATGCDILLPLVDWGVGVGSNASYHVVTQAVFHIEAGQGNEKVVGWMDDPTNIRVTTGFTSSGTCPPGSALCVVKLIDFPSNGLLE